MQHRVEYFDDSLSGGWSRCGATVHINPAIYSTRFEAAITAHRWIREYRDQPPGRRLVQKYRYIRQWLRLDKTDPIAMAIKALDASADIDDLRASEARIQPLICEKYGILRQG